MSEEAKILQALRVILLVRWFKKKTHNVAKDKTLNNSVDQT